MFFHIRTYNNKAKYYYKFKVSSKLSVEKVQETAIISDA